MNNLFFWNDWKKTYKLLYLTLFLIFIVSLVLYLLSYFIGFDAVVDWELKPTYDILKISVDEFTQNLFSYSVDSKTHLIKERFAGSGIQVNPVFSYIYLILVMTGMMIALTVITRLELIWFAMGMGIFIFFLVLLHTEVLGIFGSNSFKFTLVSILLYVGLSFYFQSYDKKFSFFQRLLSFTGLTIILAIIIAAFSQEKTPFLYLANFGMVIPIVLTVVFIISIAYDIINGFLFITSSSRTNGKNMLLHFSIISTLYIVNLLLIYLKKKRIIDWDFIYIDVFFIYIASAVIGIWGLKKRASLFTNIISFNNASFLYIAFAIISTATITYSFITGNDPLTESLQYTILYSHLGMGIVFFLYILYNFWELFYKNISAYDLVYEPRRMPFFMVRPLGIIIILSFFLQAGKYPYKLAKGGYYNAIGDVYMYEGKLKEAKDAYLEGSVYGNMNHRSNYSLGTVLTEMEQRDLAAEYYSKSLEKYPSEYSYVNLSNIYIEKDQFFYAFFTLKDGIAKFPKSGQLHNNLALLYSTKGMWDSTAIHLGAAKNYLPDHKGISSNFIWLYSRNNMFTEADSIGKHDHFDTHVPFENNKIASLTLNKKTYEGNLNKEFLEDSLITGLTFSYLFNYGIGTLSKTDTAFLKKIDHYLKYDGNIDYHFELSFLKILKLYYSGNRADAIRELNNLSTTASTSSTLVFNKVLGTWAMKQGAYTTAAEYYKAGSTLLDAKAQLHTALALLEAGDPVEAQNLILQLINTPDPEVRKTCKDLSFILTTRDLNDLKKWNDTLKFQYMHFRKSELPEQAMLQIHGMISSEKMKVESAAEIMEYYIDRNQLDKAEQIGNVTNTLVSQSKLEKEEVSGELNYQVLRLLEAKQDWQSLKEKSATLFLNETTSFHRLYFQGLAAENTGKESDAIGYYVKTNQSAPFNVAAFIRAADLYNKRNETSKAYDVLIEGINHNKYSAELQMAYALQSLKMNLTTYAEETLSTIKDLVSPQEFASFKTLYEKEKAIAEKKFEEF